MKSCRKKNITGVAWHASNLPFATNYNDHFETPFQAYIDVKPVIDWLCTLRLKTDKFKVNLYDPYYCNGKAAKQLKELGYESIFHEKRDFYMDISNNTVPAHDILITNPPFSDSHKTQCLNYCFQKLRQPIESPDSNKRPFLLLMPSYVAAKQYFRNFLTVEPDLVNDIVYLIPSQTYKYDHPEKTGKDHCPFDSLWFLGIPKNQIASFQEYWESLASKQLTLATSLAQLQSLGVISASNRPNIRKRCQIRKRMHKETLNTNDLSTKMPSYGSNNKLRQLSKPSQTFENSNRDQSKQIATIFQSGKLNENISSSEIQPDKKRKKRF